MKRFVCFLLAMILIMGMVPATAVTAFAASERTTSDKAIEILKEFEGFSAKVYSSDGKYYVGYGTQIDASKKDNYPNGITTADATALLKKYLTDTVDKALNKFAKDNNLDLTQYQHDALAVFSYSAGTAWLTSGTYLRPAVLQGKTGNDFINAIAQTNSGVETEYFKGSMNRRLAEANMYLNGNYAYNAPANYTYVVFNNDGSKTVRAFNTNSPITLSEEHAVTKAGHSFLGWYLDKAPVSTLDKNVAGKTLVAKFVVNGDKTDANYILNTASFPSLKIYDAATVTANEKGTLITNTNFKVYYEKIVDGVKWVAGEGPTEENGDVFGWVYVGKIPSAQDAANPTIIATATAKNGALDIYEGATSSSAKTGKQVAKDQTVNIYEIKVEQTATGNKSWGKVINVNGVSGWINLATVTMNEVSTENSSVANKTGKIINTDKVNVRKSASASSDRLTTLDNGTEVTVLKTEMNGAAQWGYVRWSGLSNGHTEGWVYMYYVEVKGMEHSNPEGSSGSVNTDAIQYTGVVTSNINLNVRKYADIYSAVVKTLPYGTKVNVYDTAESRNMKWGRIGDGQWVCLSYVNMTKVENSNSGTNSNTGSNAATGSSTATKGTVTTATLNVLKNYNNNAEKVGELKKGEVVTILEKNTETTATGSRIWGRIDEDGIAGWINLAYVDLKTVTTVAPGTGSSGTNTVTATAGVISDCISVNVRESAGVYSRQLTKLNNGTAVTVYDQITHENAPWARIKWNNGTNEGWVCMYYVTLNAGGTVGSTATNSNGILNGTSTNAISATGFVNNVFLNVRSGAGLGYTQIGTLNQGAKVTLFEQAVADGMIWGRISYNNTTGWVCMSYITLENASSTGKGVMGTVARCHAKANVRSAPGTNNALVATVNVGSRVEVFETRTHASQKWGRIAQGWVCMDYILLDSELPEGTVLDATTAPTTAPATTAPATTAPTVNKDNEVAYVINATVNADEVAVYNDASDKSEKVGTFKKSAISNLTVLAVKNNGVELWGRIDQFATAGWINLANTSYSVAGFVNTDNQPVYADPNTSSTVKGTLAINTELTIQKLTVNGDTVYGWVENGLAGWIPMGRVSKDRIEVLPVLDTATVACFANSITGKTNAAVDAYDATNGTKVVAKLNSGVTVYVAEINLEAGVVWGKIAYKKDGVDTAAWINMGKVTYTLQATVNNSNSLVNVRSSKSTADDTNLLGQMNAGDIVQICEISFASDGTPWAKISGVAAEFNGGYIAMSRLNTVIPVTLK